MIGAVVMAASLVSTRFSVVEDKSVSWLSGPKHERLFSFGVCVVEPGEKFEEYNPAKPGYSGFRYYPSGKEWAKSTVDRLQSWGFNTIGAWSAIDMLRPVPAESVVFTPILHMGSSAGAPWKDMWDPANVHIMEDVASTQIRVLKDESRILGYFSDNELGWWEGAVFDWSWKGPFSRIRLTRFLENRYGRSWPRLANDFVPKGAKNFNGLLRSGRLYLRPGGRGIAAIQGWMRIVSDRYYSLCRQIIKRHDPGALYLGDRYISNFYPEVAASASKYVDVLSTNLNADWPNGDFAHFYLPALHSIVKKPILITEYYACSKDNRSGNKNDSSGFPTVQNQRARTETFLNQTKQFLALPYIVGAHWFQFYDEPRFGRGDGENYNMGLVDINNRPYDELTSAAAKLDLQKLHGSSSKRIVRKNHKQPRVAQSDLPFLEKWPKIESLISPMAPTMRSDLYVVAGPNGLYLAVYWNEDRFSEGLYALGRVPDIEHAFINIQSAGTNRTFDLETEAGAISRTLGTRNTVILKFSDSVHGDINFSARLTTRHHAYVEKWATTLKVSP